MFKQSDKYNENYSAKLCILDRQVEHPNADRLTGWIIDNYRTWTDHSYNIGDKVIYFPVGCSINKRLIAHLNLFADASLNNDPEQKGYFDNNAKVKATRLRGEPSEGIILKFDVVMSWLLLQDNIVFEDFTYVNKNIDQYFDSFNDILLCQKYSPKKSNKGVGKLGTGRAKKSLVDTIVDNQFAFHYTTGHLNRNFGKFLPDDYVIMTKKLHGASGIVGNLLTERVLSWYERLLSKIGIDISKTEYKPVISSRKVVKQVGNNEKVSKHFYKTNIWQAAYNSHFEWVPKGMTVYFEIVGYTPENSPIQKGYDYGQAEGTYECYVYRITQTSVDGNVIELDWESVKNICNKYGVKHVPELFVGEFRSIGEAYFAKTGKLFQHDSDWRQKTINAIVELFVEKQDDMCLNDVPEEGICIQSVKEKKWYKLKSFAFTKREASLLEEEIDIETIESE